LFLPQGGDDVFKRGHRNELLLGISEAKALSASVSLTQKSTATQFHAKKGGVPPFTGHIYPACYWL
jgi:hypothetical protein